jgi:hypothetical protein
LALNPLVWVFVQARHWVVDPGAPSFTEIMGGTSSLVGPALVLLAVIGLGVWSFVREAPKVAEEL